jgi:lipopolysaccharide export system permease protein
MPVGDDPSTYRRTIFKNYTMNIADIDRSLHRTERDYRGDREMSVGQMQDKIAEIWSDIELADSKMLETANHQADAVFAYLDTERRESLLAGGPAARPAAGPAGTGRADSLARLNQIRPRPSPGDQSRLARSTRSNQAAEVGQSGGLTRKLLESQQKIKDSHLRQIDRYRVEIHKKFSIPFACLVFVLLGSPIAIRLGRSGMNTAIGLSILFFLIYYICLIGGEKLADRRFVSPLLAMWGPNIFFGLSAFYLIRRSAQEKSLLNLSKLDPRGLVRR